MDDDQAPPSRATVSMREFLESVAPGKEAEISDLKLERPGYSDKIRTPDILLHCDNSSRCGGVRTFSCQAQLEWVAASKDLFLYYVCQNCKFNWKTFAVELSTVTTPFTAKKYGEDPAFGPPIPARALKLVGRDRSLFLKGRRCELQGLGIAAFTYYRRVIEDQRGRIFDEVIRVLEGVDPSNEAIEELRAAKGEQRFSDSVDMIRHALPASLLINGENPLKLLHSALSEGVHAMSDDECLEMATAVRTVLFEFSERLAQALRDDAELTSALRLLNQRRAKKGQ